MGVFSKTSKDALILDRYATRLVCWTRQQKACA